MANGTAGRLSDLHKSAFWIYGVTAMVMREPFASVIRHMAAAGVRDGQVRLEILRLVVVLALMSRFFLAMGLYFDVIYARANSGILFPRKSYPADFLAGLLQLLAIVALSSTIGMHERGFGELAVFTGLAAIVLLMDDLWLVSSAMMRFSTTWEIARLAKFNTLSLGVATLAFIVMRIAGSGPALADEVAFLFLLPLVLYDITKLARGYGKPE